MEWRGQTGRLGKREGLRRNEVFYFSKLPVSLTVPYAPFPRISPLVHRIDSSYFKLFSENIFFSCELKNLSSLSYLLKPLLYLWKNETKKKKNVIITLSPWDREKGQMGESSFSNFGPIREGQICTLIQSHRSPLLVNRLPQQPPQNNSLQSGHT